MPSENGNRETNAGSIGGAFLSMVSGEYPISPKIAAGAVVFKDNCVLMVLRNKPPAKGVWSIPGGSIELGETLQEAAEREVREETGLIVRARSVCFTFDVIERDEYGRVRFHYVIVDMAADYESGEPRPGSDAADARWISADELKGLDVSPYTRKLLKECFNFQ